MANMCPLKCSDLDEYVEKAIELKCPNEIIPLLKNHRAMLYYPDPKVITKLFKFYSEGSDWDGLKKMYNAIAKK
jgi:hypothetical protein